MKLEHDDPRIIDYALGELDAQERAEIAAALRDPANKDAAATAAEFAALAALSRESLAAEAGSAAPSNVTDFAPSAKRRKVGFRAMALAASVLFIGLTAAIAILPMFSRAREAARRATPEQIAREVALQKQMEADDFYSRAGANGAVQMSAAPPVAKSLAEAPKLEAKKDTSFIRDQAVAGAATSEAHRAPGQVAVIALGVSGDGVSEESPLPGLAAAAPPMPAAAPMPALRSQQLEALGYVAGDDLVSVNDMAMPPQQSWSYEAQRTAGNDAGPAFQPEAPLPFKAVAAEPLSTFAADVDTASYAFIRRVLQAGTVPSASIIRPEECINYFDYAYPEPTGEHPFSVTVDIAACPWAPTHRLARVGIKGKAMNAAERQAANLVFLVDVSGSMDSPDKLPLVRESLKGLVSTLKASDRVALVTYAGESSVVLPPTSCEKKYEIIRAIDSLGAGGSTNGAGGITKAYELAQAAYLAGGINRVLIATDGDFNVGVTSQEGLYQLITEKAKSGVFLSVLGYGMGNLMDHTLELLADKGNGFYAYIDDAAEARRVLVEKGLSAIATIAKDVKFQLEFNPGKVAYYRQIGYENRQLAAQDFNDDTKDAGDIGPGHTVTALYELVPVGQTPTPGVDPLKYQTTPAAPANDSPETMTVKLRYKQPEASTSSLLEMPVTDAGAAFDAAPADFRFAAAVAAFAERLKRLQTAVPLSFDQIQAIAEATKGSDTARQEFVDLVVTAKTLIK